MLVAVVTLAVLVIVLAVAVMVLRRRVAAASAAAAAAQAEVVRIEAESAVLRQESTEEVAALRGQLDDTAHAAAQIEARLRDERDTARRSLDDERCRLDEAESVRAQLLEELEELRLRRAALAAGPSRAGLDLATLWELELARSERTWRHSVAPIPGGESPFPDADDPLRLAVEVEAAALREEVGAPLEVLWDAEVVKDPADALLVLRLAQELLARAARESRPAVLEVTGSDDVALHLIVGDVDEDRVVVSPPVVPDHLVSVTVDEGLRLVVHLT